MTDPVSALVERKAAVLHALATEPQKLATASLVATWVWDADAVVRSQQAEIATLQGERDALERNRDMWKDQCERQAFQLEQRTHFFDWAYRWAWEKEGNGTSDGERLDAIKHHPILTDWAKRTRMEPDK